jgi:hypothetical protein
VTGARTCARGYPYDLVPLEFGVTTVSSRRSPATRARNPSCAATNESCSLSKPTTPASRAMSIPREIWQAKGRMRHLPRSWRHISPWRPTIRFSSSCIIFHHARNSGSSSGREIR